MTTTMGPRTARAWELRQAGMTYREIGVEMGCSGGNVSQFLRCAKAHLAGQVKPTGRPPKVAVGPEPMPARAYEHCPRCGLRGAHECLSSSLPTRGTGNLGQAL